MADGIVQLPADGPGKKLDTEQLTVGANTVQRERTQVTGAADTEIARVKNADALGTDHGLVVREAPPASPQVDYATSANLAAGASVDLDATTIAATKTGKLQQVTVASSVPCRWDVKTRDGAVLVLVAVLFTGGNTGGPATESWQPVTKEGVTLAGNGIDENFRVTATNLGSLAADVHTTTEWDEV